jgi:hypothetical protein
LIAKIGKYLVSKNKSIPRGIQTDYGIPLDYWKNLLKTRHCGKGKYLNDENKVVNASVWKHNGNWNRNNTLPYESYDKSLHDDFITEISNISLSAGKKLKHLCEQNYIYPTVTSIKKSGTKDVYDLTIKEGEPAYVANGLVVHNSMRPEGDREYMELLDGLRQAGVPIPIRVMAAAGGLNIHDILNSATDDISDREKIAEYNAKIAAMDQTSGMGGEGGDAGDQQQFASEKMYQELSPIKRKKILDRKYDYEKYSPANVVNGKRYLLTARERRRLDDKMNRLTAEAMSEKAKILNREKPKPIKKSGQ